MTSNLIGARDTIVELWTRAFPPSDTGIRYAPARTLEHVNGVLSRRRFWIDAPRGGAIVEVGSAFSLIEYSFSAFVRVDTTGRDFLTLFDDIASEAILLMNVLSFYTGSWGAGVRDLHPKGFLVQAAKNDPGNLDLVIAIEALVEESAGIQVE